MSEQPNDNYDAKGSAAEVQGNLTTHIDDNIKHITAEERAFWNDNLFGSLPDHSRSVEIGSQALYKSTGIECYNESGENGTVGGGCPYILKLKHPCYIDIFPKYTQGNDTMTANLRAGIWFGPNMFKNHVAAANSRADWFIGSIITSMSVANGYATFTLGRDLFTYTFPYYGDDLGKFFPHIYPLTQVNWWYRPYIGTGGNESTLWERTTTVLRPMMNTPTGTLLAERYQFTASNIVGGALNTNQSYGIMNADGSNVITYTSDFSLTTDTVFAADKIYYSVDEEGSYIQYTTFTAGDAIPADTIYEASTNSKIMTRPGLIYCP